MTPERIAEIRRLATPATNARQLTRMLHETLDALESITAAVQEDWTSSITLPERRDTVEYAPGQADALLASDPAVITSARDPRRGGEDRRIEESAEPEPSHHNFAGSGAVVEKVGPEETAPASPSGHRTIIVRRSGK